MATRLDNVLLDVRYSADAAAGSEFATAVVRAGDGGSSAFRNENREDYISKYEVGFARCQKHGANFCANLLFCGAELARGFRFLPPDKSAARAGNNRS